MTINVERTEKWGPNTKHYAFAIRQIPVTVAVPLEQLPTAAFEITPTEFVTFPDGEVTPAGKSTSKPHVAYFINGAYCWIVGTTDVRVIALDICRDLMISTALPQYNEQTQRAAYDAYVSRTLGAYREARKNCKPSAEEIFEMTAAYGPGAQVADVVTGQRFQLPGRRTRRERGSR